MSRTRSDGGATVVRVDAITNAARYAVCVGKMLLPLRSRKRAFFRAPLAEFSAGRCSRQLLNGNACKYDGKPLSSELLFFAKQFLEIFDEAD